MRALSIDLRERIIAAFRAGGTTKKAIAERFGVSYGAVRNLIAQWEETGKIAPRYSNCTGRPAKIGSQEQERLRELVDTRPDMTLEELRDAVGVDCTPEAIHYALKRMGITFKKRR